jgi:hypothetical protein
VILFKKQLFYLEVKGQGPTKVITVRDTPPYRHAPTYQISLTYLERQKSYGPDKLRWEEAEEVEAEEKIRLKQYVSLRSKGRHNNYWYFYVKLKCFPVFRFHCVSDCLPYARITIQFNSTYSFRPTDHVKLFYDHDFLL